MKFSNKKKSFYPSDIVYSDLPNDLVDVSDEQFKIAMDRKDVEDFYVKAGRVIIIPVRPSSAHIWEPNSETWVIDETLAADIKSQEFESNIAALKSAIIAALSAEIQRRFVLVNEQIGSNFKEQRDFLAFCGYPNAFQAPAERFGAWVASVWQAANTYNAEVIAGTKPMLSPAQAVAAMPEYPKD